MKKTMCILVILFGFIFLTSCSQEDSFKLQSYIVEEQGLISIIVDVTDREIELISSDDEKVYIEYYESEKEKLSITILESQTLTIKLEKTMGFIAAKPSKEFRKILIKIPAEGVKNINVETTNENISVQGLGCLDTISLSTNGGNIDVSKLDINKEILLSAKNGNIAGSILGGWDEYRMQCEYKKGECNLPENKPEGDKALIVKCNNGDIHITFEKKK